MAQPLAEWPAAYVGLPYALHGRARPAVDCWGIVRLVFSEQLGIELPSWDAIDGRDLAHAQRVIASEGAGAEWRRVELPDARPFDLLVMRGLWRGADGLMRSGEIHCGLMAPGGRVLHVERESDALCVPLAKVMKRVTGIYRFWRLTQ